MSIWLADVNGQVVKAIVNKNLRKFIYRVRKKAVLELKVQLRVEKKPQLKVELLAQSTTFLTFLLILESSNGVESVSEIMKLFSLQSH